MEHWPDDEDILGVLTQARRDRTQLPASSNGRIRNEQVLLRLQAIRLLRRLLEEEELALFRQARPEGNTQEKVPLKALGEVLGIQSKGGVANYYQRLRAAVEDPRRRRSPDIGRRIEADQAETRRRLDLEAAKARARHHRVLEAARRLIAARPDLETDEEADEWLDELERFGAEDVLSVSQMSSMASILNLAVQQLAECAEQRGTAPAKTPEGRRAVEEALRLRVGEPPG
ncbi:hypothetical protein J0910_30100 [Nocardiopsis sp. CNT-189]|uniref:hypothetical protein n=1 Tax=Nocardiopsis oceanisediminis TaxID=2816862 RepID=UPI003B389D96